MNNFKTEKYAVGTLISTELSNMICKYGRLDAKRHPHANTPDEEDSQVPKSGTKVSHFGKDIPMALAGTPEREKNWQGDGFKVTSSSHCKYADPFMEMLLIELLPTIEELTELELLPTYSYYRIYEPGDVLKKHTDRPSCEISVTMCCGYNYENMSEDFSWPIWIKNNDTDIPLELKPGEGAIYRGCEVEHWRDMFIAPEGSWQQQVFLHYVDKNGPYTDRLWDGRPGPGYSSKQRWQVYEKDGELRYL